MKLQQIPGCFAIVATTSSEPFFTRDCELLAGGTLEWETEGYGEREKGLVESVWVAGEIC